MLRFQDTMSAFSSVTFPDDDKMGTAWWIHFDLKVCQRLQPVHAWKKNDGGKDHDLNTDKRNHSLVNIDSTHLRWTDAF